LFFLALLFASSSVRIPLQQVLAGTSPYLKRRQRLRIFSFLCGTQLLLVRWALGFNWLQVPLSSSSHLLCLLCFHLGAEVGLCLPRPGFAVKRFLLPRFAPALLRCTGRHSCYLRMHFPLPSPHWLTTGRLRSPSCTCSPGFDQVPQRLIRIPFIPLLGLRLKVELLLEFIENFFGLPRFWFQPNTFLMAVFFLLLFF